MTRPPDATTPRAAAWHNAIASRMRAAFPEHHKRPGTVGRESEFPIVWSDGTSGDILHLWPYLAENGPKLQEKREASGLLVELRGDDALYVAEVGRGTVEIVVGPHGNLHETYDVHMRARDRLQRAVEASGQRLLGYGIQPRTAPCAPIMTPKQRYDVIHDALGPPWLWFTVTASDQVHLAVDRADALEASRVCHLLTPVLVAICANSSIGGAADLGVASGREARMGEIHSEFGRHGLPTWPDGTWADLVARYARQLWLVRTRNGVYSKASGSFDDFLESLPLPQDAGPTAMDAVFEDFLMHEHYIWNSARPRSAHGTIEVRAACQQPLSESMTAAAMGIAMASGARSIGQWLDAELGPDAWQKMKRWHHAVVRDGLAAPAPLPDLIPRALEHMEAALKQRGAGEEVYLRPAWERVQAGQNPADRARAAFRAGGVSALVDHAAS